MQSRKHDSITDEDVACLIAPGHGELTEQERLAVEFLDLLSADHHAIDDEVYRELGEVFTSAQIVELGFTCANSMGLHRFIHTLDVFGTGAPVIPYSPDQVDTAMPRSCGAGLGMSETVLVTGATGLAGANICKLLIERGDHVRALARETADTASAGGARGRGRHRRRHRRRRRGAGGPGSGLGHPLRRPRWAGPARTWPTSRR